MKSYIEYMKEISADELYDSLVGYGLFADKLPPCFSSKQFLDYCKTRTQSFSDKAYSYVVYENIRNINIPRQLGIPVPMAYEIQCRLLKDKWKEIIDHFEKCTKNQKEYKISRIHVRKMNNKKSIFEMNYDDWEKDTIPTSIKVGKKYIVKADISTCFPSIYTHSIPWALLGKKNAKKNRDLKLWQNLLDKYCRNMQYGETDGLIIGPHSSNIVSEIILCKIDKKLSDDWIFIRHIDDYEAYADSENEANKFLTDLQRELRNYNLTLNHKKTKIIKLPVPINELWIRKINTFDCLTDTIDYKKCSYYLDLALELFLRDNNASVLKYAIKVLSSKQLSGNARELFEQTIFQWSLIYPYIVPLLEKYVFEVCDTEEREIEKLINQIFEEYYPKMLYEATSYAVYWAIKFNLSIKNLTVNNATKTDDAVFMVLTYEYFKKRNSRNDIQKLKRFARDNLGDKIYFDQHWIFMYEVLTQNDLKGDWGTLKKKGITFIDF